MYQEMIKEGAQMNSEVMVDSEQLGLFKPVTAEDDLTSYRGTPNWGLCLRMKMVAMKRTGRKQELFELKESLGIRSDRPQDPLTAVEIINAIHFYSANHKDALEAYFASNDCLEA